MGNFLTGCKPVSFSRRILRHGVSKRFNSALLVGCNENYRGTGVQFLGVLDFISAEKAPFLGPK